MLEVPIAEFSDNNTCAERLYKRLLASRPLLAPIATFLGVNRILKQKKGSAVRLFAFNEPIDTELTLNKDNK